MELMQVQLSVLKERNQVKINQRGIDLIKSFEGCKLTAYLCPAKVWTIGYGTTSKIKQGMTITPDQANKLLAQDVAEFEAIVDDLVTSKLNENQFSALVCFVYNCGMPNFERSTLLKKVNLNPNDATIKDEFPKWNKAGGKVLNGLIRRRKVESELYFM